MVISVLGNGWLGLPLTAHLIECGQRVLASGRRAETLTDLQAAGAEAVQLDLPERAAVASPFWRSAVLIVTLPPGGRRWKEGATERYLRVLREVTARADRSCHVLFTSSTGVYGAVAGAVVETSPVTPDTHSGRAVAAAERLLAERFADLTILRLAGLIGPGRHPGRFFGGRGRPIPRADAPVNLVHRRDVLTAITTCVARRATGTYNLCAAAHPPKGDYYTLMAGRLGLEVSGRLSGGRGDKIVDSTRARQQLSWQPVFDDLDLQP